MRFFTLSIFIFSVSLFAAQEFFAPATPSGSITVKLYPMEGITGTKLVTFGVPFPRGSITAAQLSTLRVLKGAVEIPAFVEQLTPWRHFTNTAIDGQSVRIARIQINYALTAAYPNSESITVEWGGAARTQTIATLTNPRTAWHLVTTGTFVAADSVWEPDVYAVLPKALLCEGMLRPLRMEPFVDSIRETRDDPYAMTNRQHWPEYIEQMYATKNFFFSIINEDDPRVTTANQCDYKTSNGYECWLFERPATMFNFYLRSGFIKPLREAVRCAEFYKLHIKATGFFDINPQDDSKYVYSEGMAYAYWLTGDPNLEPMFNKILPAHRGTRMRWTPTLNFWTERHSGFKLLAYIMAYEVLGGAALRDSLQQYVNDLLWHQNGAGGQVPSAGRVDGALYHLGGQHDWDWDETSYGASPWMSMFVVDPMLRIYQCGERDSVGLFIKRMGKFMAAACTLTTYNSSDNRKMWFPRYAMLYNGADGQTDEWTDNQHAMEVSAGIAYGYYFSILAGAPDTSLRTRGNDVYYTADECINDFTRPDAPASGLTAFRVGPYRQYNWQYHPSPSLGWALKQTGSVGIEGKDEGGRLKVEGIQLEARPNPFNGATPLQFTVHGTRNTVQSSKGQVKLAIFNTAGKCVAQLCPLPSALGTSYSWNASGMPAGLYIAKIKAGEAVVTKRLLLLK